jgi:group I intron endonuclease
MNKISCIYGIKNLITGKFYIGSTSNINKRWTGHRNSLRLGKHHSVKLQNSWNKHGETAFMFGIIEVVDAPELLLQAEQWYMDNWNTVKGGYNIAPTAGSPLGVKHSAETRAKVSAAGKGRKRTPEQIEKLAAANKGRKNSPESIARMTAAARCRKRGYKHSLETIEKIAKTKRGKKQSLETIEKRRAACKIVFEKKRLLKESMKEVSNTPVE